MRLRLKFRTTYLGPLLLAGTLIGEGRAAAPKTQTPAGNATEYRGMDGTVHTLAELKGHAAVVNLWATWCNPCREEMPRLQKLADTYSAKGVTFIAISLDEKETQGKIEPTIKKRGFHIPVWTGGSEKTLQELELGTLVPATLVLDENGITIGKIEGEARVKDVAARLDWLLNGRQGKQPKLVQKNDW